MLPALSALDGDVMLSDGRRVKTKVLISQIRSSVFSRGIEDGDLYLSCALFRYHFCVNSILFKEEICSGKISR